MKKKLLKIGISVAIPLSLFFTTLTYASTIGTFGSDGHFIANYDGQVNGVSLNTGSDGGFTGQLRSSLCSGQITAYVSEILNGVSYVIATSSPVTITDCHYVDGTTNHYIVSVGAFTFLNTGSNFWPYLHAGNDYYVSFSSSDPRYGGTANYNAQTPITLTSRIPQPSSTIANDFSSFQVDVNNPDVNPQSYSLEILYSRNPDFITNGLIASDYQSHQIAGSTSTIVYIQKPQALYSNSTYYAKIIDLSSNASTTVTWGTGTLTSTQNTNAPLSYTGKNPYTNTGIATSTWDSESTSSPFYVDCTGESFFSACSLKKAVLSIFAFFFKPFDFINTFFQDSINGMKSVFPFNIIYGQISDLQNITQSSTLQAETLNLSIPQIGMNQFNVLSPSTLSNLVGSDLANNIFSIERYLIWLFVGLGLIRIII